MTSSTKPEEDITTSTRTGPSRGLQRQHGQKIWLSLCMVTEMRVDRQTDSLITVSLFHSHIGNGVKIKFTLVHSIHVFTRACAFSRLLLVNFF